MLHNPEKLIGVHPWLVACAIRMSLTHDIWIDQGKRDMAQQLAIWQKGRDANGNIIGPIVSNAKPGESPHNYGLAIDVVPYEYVKLTNWNPNGPKWEELKAVANSMGLKMGVVLADGSADKPHVELPEWRKHKDWLQTWALIAGGLLIVALVIK